MAGFQPRRGWLSPRAKGKLRGKKPKLSARQARELRRLHDTGDYRGYEPDSCRNAL